jgi:hypothetical protein
MTKKQKTVAVVKVIVGLACGIAVSAVVAAAINNIVPTESMTKINKVIFALGKGIIAGLVAGEAADYGASLVGVFTDLEPLPMPGSISTMTS